MKWDLYSHILFACTRVLIGLFLSGRIYRPPMTLSSTFQVPILERSLQSTHSSRIYPVLAHPYLIRQRLAYIEWLFRERHLELQKGIETRFSCLISPFTSQDCNRLVLDVAGEVPPSKAPSSPYRTSLLLKGYAKISNWYSRS